MSTRSPALSARSAIARSLSLSLSHSLIVSVCQKMSALWTKMETELSVATIISSTGSISRNRIDRCDDWNKWERGKERSRLNVLANVNCLCFCVRSCGKGKLGLVSEPNNNTDTRTITQAHTDRHSQRHTHAQTHKHKQDSRGSPPRARRLLDRESDPRPCWRLALHS